MTFESNITRIEKGKEVVRGHELTTLMRENDFVDTIYLVLRGELPSPEHKQMLNAMFVAVIDHGAEVASAMNARISASAKNPTHASLAAGLLGFGERHGMAVEGAMKFFFEHKDEKDVAGLVKTLKEAKVRVPGYGHKVLEQDQRSLALFEKAQTLGIASKHCTFAESFRTELNEQSSKTLPLNVDGAIAAILCDMDFDVRLGNAVFLIGRVPGLLAHIVEEVENDGGIRRG